MANSTKKPLNIKLGGVQYSLPYDTKINYKSNPKRVGSKAYARYEIYQKAKTIGDYLTICKDNGFDSDTRKDLQYDYDKGFLSIETITEKKQAVVNKADNKKTNDKQDQTKSSSKTIKNTSKPKAIKINKDINYAIIKTGGKQYKVKEGDRLLVEKLDYKLDEQLKFDKVLFISKLDESLIGNPFIEGSNVEAVVTAHKKDKKINILKFRRRKHHMKRQGHRQLLTQVEIKRINIGG